MLLLRRHSAVYVALLFLLDSTFTSAFNLDTSHVIRKEGEPGSLFGFSLAMHRQLKPDKRMLLIGAPRARALHNQRANITGGLYKCEITQSNNCEQDIRIENKENQWMGVTVQSQGPGGKIVTCAHRYQRRLFVNTAQESRDITGRCYVLSQDLTIDTSSDEDGGNWKFCEGRARGHERFGSCQQGLAATFTKDYHYVVFGAPGACLVCILSRRKVCSKIFLTHTLGFSLDSGHSITKSRGLTIVAGAPRSNHSGAVVLLKKESETSTRLSPEYVLQGPGLASSFGYDVAVVDLNGDGWQDIVVGAPQFFMKDGDVGGAVYVYINQAGRWDKVTPVRLNGTKDSMFGLAVENIGDTNRDSYEDIAVGAPYDDGGAGKVYIYHGSAQGINTKPAQILSGRQNNIRLFGYSLAGNMDLDSNSYPDLAIGSLSDTAFIYRARPVISIKKDVKITPREIDLTKKTCGNSICFTVEACFTYKANPASYSPKLSNFSLEAEKERRKQGLLSRVMFLNKSRSDKDYEFSGTLDLRGQNKKACIKTKVKLKDNIKDKLRSIPIEVSVGIVGTKRQKRQNALPQLVPILDSSQASKVVTEVNFLKEGCGSDNICQSNLQLQYKLCYKENNQDVFPPLPIENGVPVFSLNDQKKDLALQVTVKNKNGDDAHEAKLVGTFPDTLSYSGFRSHKTTKEKRIICIANQNGSQADCELGNPFKRDSEATFYIILSTVGIPLDTTEIDIDLQLQTVQEQIATVKAKAKVVIELSLSVTGVARPSQVYFGGTVKGESAIKTEDEIGSLINYEFRINNLGKPLKSFGTASLNIQWPKENVDGKWLLYLVKITTTGLEDVPCSPETEINSLKHIQVSSVIRTKRETGERKTSGTRISSLLEQRKRKVLMCGNGYDARCVVIKCPLQDLDSTAVIALRSRLWNSTFLEWLHRCSSPAVLVKLNHLITVSSRFPRSLQVRVTVFPEKTVAQYGGVPWWIILVAVLAGILMLALLVFLLWKVSSQRRHLHVNPVHAWSHYIRSYKMNFVDP
uniref:Integrin subunit alpha 6 n=1 Tax=Myripristis murdjan TaxID=586833 RepID=A0A667Z438_9TELE